MAEVVGWAFESEEELVEVAWTNGVQAFEKDGQRVGEVDAEVRFDEEWECEVAVG